MNCYVLSHFVCSLIFHEQVLDLNHGRFLHLLVALVQVGLAFLVDWRALTGCRLGRSWLWLSIHVDLKVYENI